MKRLFTILMGTGLLLANSGMADPARLVCEGVLGNSGEQGETLVRFADKRLANLRDGLGVASDRFGTLWDRAGLGQINRYSLDGRLLASYKLPQSHSSHHDAATLVGDHWLLFLRRELWALNVSDETPDFEKLEIKVESIARSVVGDEILVVVAGEPRELAFYNPATKALRSVPMPPVEGDFKPGVTPDGKALVFENRAKNIYVLEGGVWQLKTTLQHENPQMVDGHYWAGAWNGTLRRFDKDFGPAPGVVLGGNTGSFIGNLPGNYEVNYPTALVPVGNATYAIGGLGCVAHLAAWDNTLQRLSLVRRIGALHSIGGHLALDGGGRVRVPGGIWEWKSGPADPLLQGRGIGGNGQVALFGNGSFFSAAFIYGTRPAVAWGRFDLEAKSGDKLPTEISDDVRGCVALKGYRRNRSLRMTQKGRMIETQHDDHGKPNKDLAVGQLQLPDAAGEPHSLACLSDGRIMAAVGGRVMEIERVDETSGNWRVVKALDSVAGETFGSDIFVTADAGWLWISDRANHRVIVTDEKLEQVSAVFGGVRGSSLSQCDSPGTVAASGRRAVVYDAGNQRVLKLRLP